MEREPWERQRGESRKAFEAFIVYRDAGPNRSYRDVAQRLHKSLTIIGRWGRRWAWTERVDAWDAHLDEIARQEQEKARKEMLDRHARIAVGMLQKAVERLVSLDADRLTAKDIARLVEVAVKVERLARGEPTENIAQEVKGQVKLDHDRDLEEYLSSDDEFLRAFQAALARRMGANDTQSMAGQVGQADDGRDAVGETGGDPTRTSRKSQGRSGKRKRDR